MASYKDLKPGLNDVSSYQTSGIPFVSGNIDTTAGGGAGVVVKFPAVTQWIKIINRGSFQAVTCAFSNNGLNGPSPSNTYNFKIPDGFGGDPAHHQLYIEVKITELWMKGSAKVDIVAGLTNIPTGSAATSYGNSWSGSVGVG
jgi:hypothetical protein